LVRFSGAQQIEIGAIQDEDFHFLSIRCSHSEVGGLLGLRLTGIQVVARGAHDSIGGL
jgi:hypothetical protein